MLKATADKLNISLEEAKQAIIVFDKEGCSRCNRTLDYLARKKIPHFILNITKDKESDELMSGFVLETNLNLATVTTPLIVMGGDIHFNISNLDAFMNEMRKFNKKKGD